VRSTVDVFKLDCMAAATSCSAARRAETACVSASSERTWSLGSGFSKAPLSVESIGVADLRRLIRSSESIQFKRNRVGIGVHRHKQIGGGNDLEDFGGGEIVGTQLIIIGLGQAQWIDSSKQAEA